MIVFPSFKTIIICQGRLGTNVGNVGKREPFRQVGTSTRRFRPTHSLRPRRYQCRSTSRVAGLSQVRQLPVWSLYTSKTITLPRQARDRHAINSEKKPFAAGGHSSHGAPGAGYGVHSVAATVEACRSNQSGYYVNNTNGGRITTQGYLLR